MWQTSLKDINDHSINSRHCLIQFKVIHRLQKKLHRIFQNVPPLCDKCKSVDADLSHSFIFCSKIQCYWKIIFDVLSEIFKVQLQPALFILGFSESGAQHKMLAYNLTIAKNILLFWKKKKAPTCKLWLGEMISTLHLEPIRFEGQIWAVRQNLAPFSLLPWWKPYRLMHHLLIYLFIILYNLM